MTKVVVKIGMSLQSPGTCHANRFLNLAPVWVVALCSILIASPSWSADFSTEIKQLATEQVRLAAQAEDVATRARAAEASAYAQEIRLPLLTLALRDEAVPVRFAALMAIGKARLTELGPAAASLLDDPNPNVQAAAIFACVRTGQPADVSRLAVFAHSKDVGLRSNAYLVLGRLGDASAVPMLESASMTPYPMTVDNLQKGICEVQLAEALARLGNDTGYETLRAMIFDADSEVRVFAVTVWGDLNDRAYLGAVRTLALTPREDLPELPIAAAVSLAKYGDPIGSDVLIEAAQTPTLVYEGASYPAFTLQAQAALGLGHLPSEQTEAVLADLLNHEQSLVQMSAAKAILQGKAKF